MSNVTRSAACRRVSPEMSSTILTSRGSEGKGADEDSAGAVANHLDEPAKDLHAKEAEMSCNDHAQVW